MAQACIADPHSPTNSAPLRTQHCRHLPAAHPLPPTRTPTGRHNPSCQLLCRSNYRNFKNNLFRDHFRACIATEAAVMGMANHEQRESEIRAFCEPLMEDVTGDRPKFQVWLEEDDAWLAER